MTTQEMQKLNRLEKEMEVLKSIVANIIPFDNEGEYKNTFLKEMKKQSETKSVFEYNGKKSLIKKLA